MGIQEEIHKTLNEIQQKIKLSNELTNDDLESLLLAALIEEEG